MKSTSFLDGVFAGIIILSIFLAIIIFLVPPTSTYMVALDGVKIESVEPYNSRGRCLEQLETNMKNGPNQLVWQCVDRKD